MYTAIFPLPGGGTDFVDFNQQLTFDGTTTHICVNFTAVIDTLVEIPEIIVIALASFNDRTTITIADQTRTLSIGF